MMMAWLFRYRAQRRVDRLRRASKLPAGKTWDTFEHDRTPVQLRQQLQRLAEGDFVDHGVNVLAFLENVASGQSEPRADWRADRALAIFLITRTTNSNGTRPGTTRGR